MAGKRTMDVPAILATLRTLNALELPGGVTLSLTLPGDAYDAVRPGYFGSVTLAVRKPACVQQSAHFSHPSETPLQKQIRQSKSVMIKRPRQPRITYAPATLLAAVRAGEFPRKSRRFRSVVATLSAEDLNAFLLLAEQDKVWIDEAINELRHKLAGVSINTSQITQ